MLVDQRATHAKFLNDLVSAKQRKKANEISNMTIIGDIKEKDAVIIDDMIDTAGTLTKSAQLFIDYGASSVSAVDSSNSFWSCTQKRENRILKELIVNYTKILK